MKRVKYLVLCFVLIFCLTSCGTGGTGGDTGAQTDSGVGTQSSSSEEREGDSSALIVYFSAMGNTRAAAEILAEMQGAELCEIVPEEPYTEADLDYNNDSCRANEEQNDDNARPAISGEIEHIEDYDVIYVGCTICRERPSRRSAPAAAAVFPEPFQKLRLLSRLQRLQKDFAPPPETRKVILTNG